MINNLNKVFCIFFMGLFFYGCVNSDAIRIKEIREKLYKIDSHFWPMEDKKLEIKFIGEFKEIQIYKTELIWGDAGHMTHRIVFFNENEEYLGQYVGIQSDIKYKDGIIEFIDFAENKLDKIDLREGIPKTIFINSEYYEFNE